MILIVIFLVTDGAPIHTTALNLKYLGHKFPLVISKVPACSQAVADEARAIFMAWPARSPDLSSLDHYLWARLKEKVYAHPFPATEEEMREKILVVGRQLNGIPDELRRAQLRTRKWAERCIQLNGDYVK